MHLDFCCASAICSRLTNVLSFMELLSSSQLPCGSRHNLSFETDTPLLRLHRDHFQMQRCEALQIVPHSRYMTRESFFVFCQCHASALCLSWKVSRNLTCPFNGILTSVETQSRSRTSLSRSSRLETSISARFVTPSRQFSLSHRVISKLCAKSIALVVYPSVRLSCRNLMTAKWPFSASQSIA